MLTARTTDAYGRHRRSYATSGNLASPGYFECSACVFAPVCLRMSSENAAGPSGISSRAKKQKTSHESFCGLSDNELRNILSAMDGDISEEEPFVDSGSEYVPQSDSESEGWESQEDDLEEEKQVETNNENNSDSDSENIEHFDIVWGQEDFRPTKHVFDNSSSGVKNENLLNETLEVNYFLHLFPEELATIIIAETNRNAQEQEANDWKDIDVSELFIFISLTLLMPHVKKTDIKNYWSKDSLIRTPIFGEKMSRDRYLAILRYLHFSNNAEGDPNDRMRKLGVVLNTIKSQFQSQFYPFENLVIDESMILFKGRLSFKQYIKTKKHRFGIKLYVLCDCETGFVLDFLVYIGKNTDVPLIDNLGSSGSVVVKLLGPHLNKGHTFYSDNYYTSPSLSTYLYDHKTNSCGTVRQNRKQMPDFKKKLNRGEIDWKSSTNILALKWKDRREVAMLTTFHENEVITLQKIDRITQQRQKKPLCVIDYNAQMGAIDRSDMMISSVDSTRKTIKWYKKLFFHTLDLCMLNAHALYCTQNAKKVPFPKFHREVIRQILERFVYIFFFFFS